MTSGAFISVFDIVRLRAGGTMVCAFTCPREPGFETSNQRPAMHMGASRFQHWCIFGAHGPAPDLPPHRYDVEGISDGLFEQCVPTVFSEPQTDNTSRILPLAGTVGGTVTAVATAGAAIAGASRRRVRRRGAARPVRPARRLGQPVHPAHQPGRAPRGAQRQGVRAGRCAF